MRDLVHVAGGCVAVGGVRLVGGVGREIGGHGVLGFSGLRAGSVLVRPRADVRTGRGHREKHPLSAI
ncbi:hypothetical protein AB0E25_40930 [Streptomyces bobili]|uniref:hypothetical protein n=1 Tax=Streptomyces bobili TaxID=67280 RepID=UPI00340E1555